MVKWLFFRHKIHFFDLKLTNKHILGKKNYRMIQ